MALVLKRFFMKELEREKFEKQILEEFPEWNELLLFQLDDFEIKELVDKITRKNYSLV